MQELRNPDTLIKFSEWIEDHGVDVLQPKIWEILRFKIGKDVGIIYHNKYGTVTTATPLAVEAWEKFSHKLSWFPVKSERKQATKIKRRLFDQFGGECFYCGVEYDINQLTVEDLIPLSHGGKPNKHNRVLADEKCNRLAASMHLLDKLELRDQLRGYK